MVPENIFKISYNWKSVGIKKVWGQDENVIWQSVSGGFRAGVSPVASGMAANVDTWQGVTGTITSECVRKENM